jgi:hypothetical protein
LPCWLLASPITTELSCKLSPPTFSASALAKVYTSNSTVSFNMVDKGGIGSFASCHAPCKCRYYTFQNRICSSWLKCWRSTRYIEQRTCLHATSKGKRPSWALWACS